MYYDNDPPLSPSVETLWKSLPQPWRHPEVQGQDPPWVSRSALSAFLADEEPTAWRPVVLEGDEWFLLLLDDSARLFRYAGGGTYECRFLGPLYGGTYTESYSWRDEAPHLRLEFEHERVKLELELQADKKMSEADQTVREAFRRWASKPV